MYLYLWIFTIYAFIGWCTEVIYAAVSTGKFVNRGFLNGPFCPIYGFGVLIIIWLIAPLKENILLMFLGSVLLTSELEWLTGWALEKIFHHKWWDYSDYPFNISGYICLKFSLMWGMACLLVINVIHPLVLDFITLINIDVGEILLSILLTVIAVDVIATIQSVLNLNRQLKQINEMAAKIRNLSDELGEKISEESLSLMEKSEELKSNMEERKSMVSDLIEEKMAAVNDSIEERKEILIQKYEEKKAIARQLAQRRDDILNKSFFGQRRLLNAFPDIKSNRYKEALDELKEKIFKK